MAVDLLKECCSKLGYAEPEYKIKGSAYWDCPYVGVVTVNGVVYQSCDCKTNATEAYDDVAIVALKDLFNNLISKLNQIAD